MKNKIRRVIYILLILLVLMTSLYGCQQSVSKQDKEPSSHSDGNDEGKGETLDDDKVVDGPIELEWMFFDRGIETSRYDKIKDGPVVKEIEQMFNIKLSIIGVDTDKKQVIMASGATSDILNIQSQADIEPLIKGNLLLPLDDLIDKLGDNIKELKSERLDAARTILSDDSGKIYVLTCNAGNEGHVNVPYHSVYMLRWDYYKEMGYPKVKNLDDMLNVLKDMQEKYPQTEDGKPVYGVSLYGAPTTGVFQQTFGYKGVGPNTIRVSDNELIHNYADEESLIWLATEYFNKAHRMGILDPDSLTQGVDEFNAKADAGQLLSPWWYNKGTAFVEAALAKDPESIVGFQTLPVEGMTLWANTQAPAGWQAFFNAIPKTCSNPEKVMEMFNYFYGYEGSRLIKSGVEGVHWEMVGGKPELKDETIDLYLEGGEEWTSLGINQPGNLEFAPGLGNFELCPDGEPLLLFGTEKFFVRTNKPVDEDFAKYYGGVYPFGVFEEFIEEGKIFDHSEFDGRLLTLGTPDEDIARIDAKLDDIWTKSFPKLILAESSEEYESAKLEAIKEFKAANADVSKEWWQKRYNEIREVYGH